MFMKQKAFLAAWLLALCAMAAANPIDQAEARQMAQAFMSQKGKTLQSIPYRAPSRNSSASPSPLYIFNAEAGAGFVVVSGDDRTEAILGYADEGSFDEQNIPDNMRAWLQGYADVIEHLDATSASASQQSTPKPTPVSIGSGSTASGESVSAPKNVQYHTAISPLLMTKWDQGDVYQPTYNQYCPKDGDLYCYTGCVATAMAQIMYYHRWPQDYTTSVSGLDPIQFDWNAMQTIYRATNTQQDYQTVARLMQYCGYAVDMDYGTDGSGALSYNVVKGLTQNFDYAPSAHYLMRDFYSIESWDGIIYHELEESRPVYYAGASTGGGHAFVCDGYDGRGYYHINWGWGGSCNGYFKLTVLNPHGSGIGGSSTSDGYSMSQEIIIGIQPSTAYVEPEPQTLSIYEWEVTDNSIQAFVYNLSGSGGTFNMGYATMNEDGTPDLLFEYEGEYYIDDFNGGYGLPCPIADLGLDDGIYVIGPVSKLSTDDEWHFCQGIHPYIVVEIENGNISIRYNTEPQLQAESIIPMGNRIVNMPQEVMVNIENQGMEYYGTLYLFASKTNNKGEVRGKTGIAIGEGDHQSLSLYFTPEQTGTYNLWVTTDENGNNVITTGTIDILSPPTEEIALELTNCEITPKETTTIAVEIKNNGDVPGYRPIIALLYNENDLNSYETYQATGNLNFQPGESEQFTFTFEDLIPGMHYTALICYYKTHQDSHVTVLQQTDWFEIEETYTPDFSEEKARLQQMADDLSAGIGNLQPRIDALTQQYEDLMGRYEAARQRFEDLRQQYMQIQEKLEDANIPSEIKETLKQTLSLINEDIDLLTSELNQLSSRLETGKANLHAINSMSQSLYSQYNAVLQHLANAATLDDLNYIEKLLEVIQKQYSDRVESLNAEEANVSEITTDLSDMVLSVEELSASLDNADASIDLEIARQEVAEALDELPSLAPRMGYDPQAFDLMRQIIADWRQQEAALMDYSTTLQQRLHDEQSTKILTAEERESLGKELSDIQHDLYTFTNVWDSFILHLSEYAGLCDHYEQIYEDLLVWIDQQRQLLQEATSMDEIEAIEQQINDKRNELNEMPIPTLAPPHEEELETDFTNDRLQAIDLRLHEIEALLNKVPTDINRILSLSGGRADVWTLSGQLIRRQATSLSGLPAGIYVVNGQKVTVRSSGPRR